jgi:hypothetical protein
LALNIAAAPPANIAPTVVTAAAAAPNPVITGATTALSVFGADNGGESNLTYTWAATGTSPAPVSFSVNGSNAAKNTTAGFTKAGIYNFVVTIKDAGNLTVTSSKSVTVNQSLTSITVAPATVSVMVGRTQAFSASGKDQFGTAMTITPTWAVSGGGTISASGLFTATTVGGPFSATATFGGKSGTASLSVTNLTSAGLVRLVARDQNGIEVTGAQVFVYQKSTWYPTGTQVQLQVGTVYNFKGKSSQGIEGVFFAKTVDSVITEIAVPFQKVTLQAKDQFGTSVTGATIGVYNVTGTFAVGSAFTFPEGAVVYTAGKVMGLSSSWNRFTIVDGMTAIVTPFWKATVRVKDSSGIEIVGGKVELYGATAGLFATGSSVTLGKGTYVYARALVGTSYGSWITKTFTDGLTELVVQ